MDDMTFIEGMLGDASASIAFPPTPQLRGRVLQSIAMPRQAARSTPRFAFAAVAGAAAVVIAVALAVPTSRAAVADFFGIEGSEVDVLPTPPAGTTPTPFPTPHDIDTSAQAAPLAEIESAIGRPAAIPEGLAPTSSYLVPYGESPAAILRFEGFDLWQIDGAGDFEGIVGKNVDSEAAITDTTVNGAPARWISGGPHLVAYYDASGSFDEETLRTVERNTLIWRSDAALYRIETNLGLEETIAIAEALP